MNKEEERSYIISNPNSLMLCCQKNRLDVLKDIIKTFPDELVLCRKNLAYFASYSGSNDVLLFLLDNKEYITRGEYNLHATIYQLCLIKTIIF